MYLLIKLSFKILSQQKFMNSLAAAGLRSSDSEGDKQREQMFYTIFKADNMQKYSATKEEQWILHLSLAAQSSQHGGRDQKPEAQQLKKGNGNFNNWVSSVC